MTTIEVFRNLDSSVGRKGFGTFRQQSQKLDGKSQVPWDPIRFVENLMRKMCLTQFSSTKIPWRAWWWSFSFCFFCFLSWRFSHKIPTQIQDGRWEMWLQKTDILHLTQNNRWPTKNWAKKKQGFGSRFLGHEAGGSSDRRKRGDGHSNEYHLDSFARSIEGAWIL